MISRQRVWRPQWQIDLAAIMHPLRSGRGDLTCRAISARHWIWATRTPVGPVLLELQNKSGDIVANATGAGALWQLENLPTLLGAQDDPGGFLPLPEHEKLQLAWRQYSGWRVPKTQNVMEALAVAALSQLVTGVQAFSGYRYLTLKCGTPVAEIIRDLPNDHPAQQMRFALSARQWANVPNNHWVQAGVDAPRRLVIQQAATAATSLAKTVQMSPIQADRALQTLRGVGVWTSAEIRQRAHGDADAFSFFDYHVAKDVTWALTGQVQDDAACAEILEPYAGHRFRVQRLLSLAGHRRPRFGPKMTLPKHRPLAAG